MRRKRFFIGGMSAAALVVLLGGLVAEVQADELTSKGTTLRGQVKGITPGGVEFAPEYGKGVLSVKWDDVQDLRTDGPFRILHGDDDELSGPITGFSGGKLQAGEGSVDPSTIALAGPLSGDGLGLRDRVRSTMRYWHGNFDAGLNVQQATTESTGFVLGMKTTRSRGPLRLMFGGDYRYGSQKRSGEERTRTLDQAIGGVRGEYDITDRIYAFASGDATYDGIQRLSIRGVPKLGLGYTIWEEQLDETTRNFLQADVGGSWVYEKYFGGVDRDYFAIAFGAQAGYSLPFGARLAWRFDFLPAVDDFTNDYLLRNDLGLIVPLFDPISAKFSLLDEYDSTPAPGTNYNNLFMTVGLSVGW